MCRCVRFLAQVWWLYDAYMLKRDCKKIFGGTDEEAWYMARHFRPDLFPKRQP